MKRYPLRGTAVLATIGLALTCLVSCKPKGGEAGRKKTAGSTERLPALRGESWLESLAVPGFAPASLAVPLGATQPRPVLVALHGAADRPEWQCGTWRGVTNAPFILCPRGQRAVNPGATDRYTFETLHGMEAELRAGLEALKARHGRYVAKGSIVLAGFARSADLALGIARQSPAFFSKVVLIEGGAARWSSSFATIFAQGGGERVLFACGRPSCGATAERAIAWSERAGVDARLAYAGPREPYWDPRLAARVREAWPWLVGDDARWSP